jgi:hypothetical protein
MKENLGCILVIFTAIFIGEFIIAVIAGNVPFALWRLTCLVPILLLLATVRKDLQSAKNTVVLSNQGLRWLRRIRRRHKLDSLPDAFDMSITTQLGLDEVRARGGLIIIRDEKTFKELRIRSSDITPEKIAEFFGEEDFMKGDDRPGDLEV